MKRVGNLETSKVGSFGVNMGTCFVNEKFDMISNDADFTNRSSWFFHFTDILVNKSNDDDGFRASFWRRHYALEIKAHRIRYGNG